MKRISEEVASRWVEPKIANQMLLPSATVALQLQERPVRLHEWIAWCSREPSDRL